MRSDVELLREFVRTRSDESFATLVQRHLNLVYSAALRQVRSPHLAEEVVQSAFADLARKAHSLAPNTILSAWLYQVTRRTAIDAIRRETRRRQREQAAYEMNSIEKNHEDWPRIEPLLDEAMEILDENDRAAVLLRYFENKPLREVGLALGASEDAAQKRVSRAVNRLREFFAENGVTVASSGIALLLANHAVKAAPAGLMVTVHAPGAASAAAVGSMGSFWIAKIAALLVALGVVTVLLMRPRETPPSPRGSAPATSGSLSTESRRVAMVNGPGQTSPPQTEPQPDARSLLLGVAAARQRIASGSCQFFVTVENFRSQRIDTNLLQLTALFDGSKLRFEQTGREYSYTYSENEAEAERIRNSADGMSRDAAVRAGLLKPFASRHVLAYDGEALMNYWETDGKPNGATIDDPGKGASELIFDPRCFGLATFLSAQSSVENCLGCDGSRNIQLIGRETIEGGSAWRVQVRSKYGETLDFWISADQPERLLKHASRGSTVVSSYDRANPRDCLPTEVFVNFVQNGATVLRQQIVRSNSQFNILVSPASFTLAGLGMKAGTPVSDIRIQRRIGYWTGSELSENLPRKSNPAVEPARPPAEPLATLENNPGSPEGLEAAVWILLNTPDGAAVEKAAGVILRYHTRDESLGPLCPELERLRHHCSKPLLEALLKENPSSDIRAVACFNLAMLLKEEGKHGENKKATAEAEKQFERVIRDFGRVRTQGRKMEDLARLELDEIRGLAIGKQAPEIVGEDLDGQPLKLSDFKGNVIVLTFWWPGYSEARDHRKLAERLEGKPVAFLGVYGDDSLDKALRDVEKYGINWPSFRDRRNGPISKAWHIQGWPETWVLDKRGVIRYRGVRGRELTDAVDKLLRE